MRRAAVRRAPALIQVGLSHPVCSENESVPDRPQARRGVLNLQILLPRLDLHAGVKIHRMSIYG